MTWVRRRYGMSMRHVVGLWLFERGSDALVLAFIWGLLSAWWLATALGGAFIIALLIPRRSPAVPGFWSRRSLVVSLLLSSIAWIVPALGMWIALSLAAPDSSSLFGLMGTAFKAFSSGTLAGGLTGVPAGAGVSGSAAIWVLRGDGIPAMAAILTVFVIRAATTWFALFLGIVALVLWRRELLRWFGSQPLVAQAHFDELGHTYDQQLPEFLRQRLIGRKVERMHDHLQHKPPSELVGLDIGCGHGWYAHEMQGLGFCMVGCDLAASQAANAAKHAREQGHQALFNVGSATELPYPSNHFDFAYSINVFHHVIDPGGQEKAFAEVVRVLKPGGVFFLQEINTENPLFRFYMGYVFPLFRDIDEGTERWLLPTKLPEVEGASWEVERDYFTFLPDFVPEKITRGLSGMEQRLERSRMRHWSAHYIARLRKADSE
jgi:ubiquinone/menaquinone biosynthesis C-methylase UbiE